MTLDDIGTQIVDAAYCVHCALGAGLLENCYETCLAYELASRGLKVERQAPQPLYYKGVELETGYRMDLLVEDSVVVELKAVEQMQPIYKAQLLTYMKLGGYQLGYLINFNVPRIKDGINRMKI